MQEHAKQCDTAGASRRLIRVRNNWPFVARAQEALMQHDCGIGKCLVYVYAVSWTILLCKNSSRTFCM